jgi:very-short-patch-repair endonuclease
MKGGNTVTALAIEVDGEVQANQTEHDAERQSVLATAGMRVLRFPNASIEHVQSGVLETIRAAARDEQSRRPTGPSRTPGR